MEFSIIHFGVTPFAIQWLNGQAHYRVESNYAKIVVDAFCPELNPGGKISGLFAIVHNAANSIDAFISDSIFGANLIRSQISHPKPLTLSLRYASKYPKSIIGKEKKTELKTVLWAHRSCFQKNPMLAVEIANLMDDCTFIFAGSGVDKLAKIRGLPKNILIYGEFEDLSEVVSETKAEVLLNTSYFDGAPNVIKEAISLNLPVVSSCVGGIPNVCLRIRHCALT